MFWPFVAFFAVPFFCLCYYPCLGWMHLDTDTVGLNLPEFTSLLKN